MAVVVVAAVDVVADVVVVVVVDVAPKASIQTFWTVPGTVVILRHLRRFQCCRGTCKPLARVSQTDIMHHLALYPQNMKNTTPVTALTSSWLCVRSTALTNSECWG